MAKTIAGGPRGFADEPALASEAIHKMRQLIKAALGVEDRAHVEKYFCSAPTNRYAGADFNTLGINDPDAISGDDLLAVHLLGRMSFDPPTVRSLLLKGEIRRQITRLLCDIDPSVAIWADDAEPAIQAADRLWHVLKGINGIGPVIAGKLLARKRPRLVPILDERVDKYFNPPLGKFWGTLQAALREAGLPDMIESALRPDTLRGSEIEAKVTTIRLLDVAVWMK